VKKVLHFLFFLLFPVTSILRAENADQNALLDAVAQMRATVIAQIASGYGIAQVQSDNFQPNNGLHELTPLHRVEFYFSGNNSLWRDYDPNDPKKLISCVLVKNGIQIDYATKEPGFGAVVAINAASHEPSVLEPLPEVWTYIDLTRIPGPGWDENKFFRIAVREPYVVVSKIGDSVITNIDIPLQQLKPYLYVQNMTAKFDMSMGGMMSYYKYINSCPYENETGKTYEIMCLCNVIWKNTDHVYVPVTRDVDINFEMNGQNAGYWRTHIKFIKFVASSISPDELNVTAMRIPIGTPVSDYLHEDRFIYSPAQDQRMLGLAVATTAPAGTGK